MATTTVPRETLEESRQPGIQLGERILQVPVDLIDVGDNVRADAGDVAELAASIAEHGVLQPIRIREAGDRYQVVYGQRRLLASRQAALERIPAILDTAVKNPDWRTVEQLVENIQRADLNALDQARALKALVDAGLTHDAIAHRLGRSRPWVSNLIGILDVAPKVQQAIAAGDLTTAHAKVLSGLSKRDQEQLARDTTSYGYSSHQLEDVVKRHRDAQKREAEEVEKLATWAEQTEAELIEKGADKKTSTITTVDGYGYSADREIKALKARGWKAQTASWSRGKCDCDAWGVQRTWDHTTRIVRRCIVSAHYDAKLKAEGRRESVSWQEQNRLRAEHDAKKKRLHEAVAATFTEAFKKLPADVARILLWSVLDYSLNDWVREHKGDRKKPDAWGALSDQTPEQLAAELTRHVFRTFDDRYNVKLDLEAIAGAFGVSLEPPAKARKAKATAA